MHRDGDKCTSCRRTERKCIGTSKTSERKRDSRRRAAGDGKPAENGCRPGKSDTRRRRPCSSILGPRAVERERRLPHCGCAGLASHLACYYVRKMKQFPSQQLLTTARAAAPATTISRSSRNALFVVPGAPADGSLNMFERAPITAIAF
ncbi:hypothetical protein EVAR_55215_1 [Eumeta japonica]|uniref:Uncharacterized protein n=1 Tax=Eumeta variegata TaxID=151549 RepID=A0A4C1ZS94_EUMVA|nr:hypothetical protein EVAR_55215_1 [Eumeta japonica]